MTPKIIIPDSVYQKIMWWINKSHHEVSGFGSMDFDVNTCTFTVRDAILLKQEVAPTSTEIDPVALGKAMFEMRAEINALKWHWHSHVNMGVFWSGDDKTLIKNLGSQGWITATVFNKRAEMKSAFYTMVNTTTRNAFLGTEETKDEELFLEDVSTQVTRYIDEDLYKAWDAQYAEHVSVEKRRPYPLYEYNRSSYDHKFKERKGFCFKAKRDVSRYKNATNDEKYAPGYDKYGFSWSYGNHKWCYNPIFDEDLKTDAEIIKAMRTMDDEEVGMAARSYTDKDEKFIRLYDENFAEKKIAIIEDKKLVQGLEDLTDDELKDFEEYFESVYHT